MPVTDPTAAPATSAAAFAALTEKVRQYRPQEDVDLLRRAFEFSAREHAAQTRASGEAFLSHPLGCGSPAG